MRRLDLPHDAADDFAAVLGKVPGAGPAYYLELAETLADAGDEFLGDGVRVLDAGLIELGPLVVLESRAIDFEVALGRYDAALERIDRVLDRISRQAKWLIRRGDVLQAAGRDDEAARAFGLALAEITALPGRLRQTRASQAMEAQLRNRIATGPRSR